VGATIAPERRARIVNGMTLAELCADFGLQVFPEWSVLWWNTKRERTWDVTLFGAWLVQRGKASAAQILTALDAQERQRPALQEIAMSEHRLTASQVLDILGEQRKTGLCFGVLAMERGLLNKSDVDTLRTEQMRHGPKLGEVLVQLGVLTPRQLERELADFHGMTRGPAPPMPNGRLTPPAWPR
jgi:hypothetical protein